MISGLYINMPQRMQVALYTCGNKCTNMPFKMYTENMYLKTLSLIMHSISISTSIGNGTETRSNLIINFTQNRRQNIYKWTGFQYDNVNGQ